LEVCAYCIMSSHIHMILGRNSEPNLESIIREKYTSLKIIEAITDNQQESRKELLLWLFERAGRKNSNNKKYQFGQQDYLYSSAINYAQIAGELLEVILI
jgi:putative transposase